MCVAIEMVVDPCDMFVPMHPTNCDTASPCSCDNNASASVCFPHVTVSGNNCIVDDCAFGRRQESGDDNTVIIDEHLHGRAQEDGGIDDLDLHTQTFDPKSPIVPKTIKKKWKEVCPHTWNTNSGGNNCHHNDLFDGCNDDTVSTNLDTSKMP